MTLSRSAYVKAGCCIFPHVHIYQFLAQQLSFECVHNTNRKWSRTSNREASLVSENLQKHQRAQQRLNLSKISCECLSMMFVLFGFSVRTKKTNVPNTPPRPIKKMSNKFSAAIVPGIVYSHAARYGEQVGRGKCEMLDPVQRLCELASMLQFVDVGHFMPCKKRTCHVMAG